MPPDDFARAQQLFQQGDAPAAAAICKTLVQAQPRRQEAWRLLAAIAQQSQDAEQLGLALKGLANALAAARQFAEAHTAKAKAVTRPWHAVKEPAAAADPSAAWQMVEADRASPAAVLSPTEPAVGLEEPYAE